MRQMKFILKILITFHFIDIRTIDSIGGLSPASINKIFQYSTSLKRFATMEPAVPAPTTMKS